VTFQIGQRKFQLLFLDPSLLECIYIPNFIIPFAVNKAYAPGPVVTMEDAPIRAVDILPLKS
jgi:hypothetical protein